MSARVTDDAPVLALVGPTASGKSQLALELARRRLATDRPTELVAVDAFTVYRGMDLGTAKPSPAQRAEVAHHLVDELDPGDELSVAAFRDRARAAVAAIHARGATPLLVGGSGLYLRAVIDDLHFPPTDPTTSTDLEDRYADDPGAAHAELASRDPAAAAHIDPANLRRSVRALEVIALTGERLSAFGDAWERYESIYPGLEVATLDPPREVLRERIEDRCRTIVDAGLLDEARSLRDRSPALSRTARQAIGYAEAFAVLDDELTLEELPAAIARRTWRYARRQRSWFRRDPRCAPTDPTTVNARWASPRSGRTRPATP